MRISKTCEHCGEIYTAKVSFQKYCSKSCRHKQFLPKKHYENLKTSAVGTVGELRVASDLITKGFFVFKALDPYCPCDLITMKDNELARIQVRTTYLDRKGNLRRNAHKEDKQDVYAWVLKESIVYEPELDKARKVC